ncbi:MAG TPA: nucleoside phosphorylase [Anaerolineaceae bacterium]|nr:nucleoside phosphorylase [Anaerolineaceae bacterium]
MTETYPILEFDPTPSAILEPDPVEIRGPIPDRGVMCFFQDVLTDLLDKGRLEPVGVITSELGAHPIFRMTVAEQSFFVLHGGLGAPLSAALLEEVIALGVKKIIACGGCGVLNKEIAVGHPIVLTSAVRDEGTSYHYLPPGREACAHPQAVAALEAACQEAGVDYRRGKAWTTDAIYRETVARRERRLKDGCIVVEMEAAAFFAVAEFRQAVLGEIVYGGDLVVPEGWDGRKWNHRRSHREFLFQLAVQACLKL